MTFPSHFLALAACVGLAACKSTSANKSADPSAADVSSPYSSNYNDGHYNPYPGQTGSVSDAGSTTPSYDLPPMPSEPPPNPYAFDAPKKSTTSTTTSSSSSKPKTSSSSSSKPKSKPKTVTSSKSKSKAKPKSSTSSKYTVSKGDTLYGIALRKKTTVAKLKAANGLKSDTIRPGQSLKIP